MIAQIEVMNIYVLLERKVATPQIKARLQLINTWHRGIREGSDILNFDKVRVELRDLIKFITDDCPGGTIYTNLLDEDTSISQNEVTSPAYDFEAYKLKVNGYIEEHKDNPAYP